MRRALIRAGRIALTTGLTWTTAAVSHHLHSNRSIVSMALLLEIVAVATLGDWILSAAMSAAASLAFSWYFIDKFGSLAITTPEGAVTFSAMVFTAITVSVLAIRGRRRADEAIRRREEMERLQQFGSVLLTAATVGEAARKAVNHVVTLFDLRGASIRLRAGDQEFRFGSAGEAESTVGLGHGAELILYGSQPSAEVRSALGHIIGLVLDRARNTEESTRTETTKRSEELRTTVLNALAHNFRTPLTSIKAAASMLRSAEDISTVQGRELVAVIDEEADRLDRLIGESLDLARIEAHRESPRTERCSIADIVNAVTARVSRYLGNRELAVKVSGELPLVSGDRFLFEQMLMQVVDNAWKYSKPGSRIEITAVESEDRVILTVRNEGNAIPDNEREQIFAKFYRGSVNRSHVEGTGLGLSIARSIAEAHGGNIWLDSEPAGPAFQFSLPAEVMGIEG
jgi:two-component system, OmpR family, sensor histidine kinase KdpD